jgi:uncharacterized oligopeptide transporter (OPT) family protein
LVVLDILTLQFALFVIVGVFIALVMELCGIKALSFAIGIYLPLSTTLPIFVGGAVRGIVDHRLKKRGSADVEEEEDLRKGNLFATGLVAGGALMGVIVAILSVNESINAALRKISVEHGLTEAMGQAGYYLLGAVTFGLMTFILYRVAMGKK